MAFNKILSKKFLTSSFLSGSLVMILGSNVHNFGQFAYHFLAGRFLGKVGYGDLAAIISILGIITIIQSALNTTIIKFIASEKSEEKITNFTKWVYKWTFWSGIFAAAVVLILSPAINSFLNLTDSNAIYLLAPILFFYILVGSGRSILQGLLKFNLYVFSLITETIVKLPLTVVLVFWGFAVFGALGGILVGVILSFVIIRLFLEKYLQGKKESSPALLPLVKYSSATFVQGLALTSMYSTDLILVKHFFSSETAGIYASLAVLGRIVFFGVSPVTQVMFPMVAKRSSSGEKYKFIFYLSLLLVLAFAATVTLFFFFFPNLVIGTLYGHSFLGGREILWWFGLFMSILSLAMLFTQYYLSLGKTRVIWFFAFAAILQILLIWFIHPNILTVIQLSILAASLLVLLLFIYFLYQLFKWPELKKFIAINCFIKSLGFFRL